MIDIRIALRENRLMSEEIDFTAESVPPRSGMSDTARLFLGIAAGCFTALVLGCGGLAYFGWKFFKEAYNDDPVVVRQETAKIVSIDLPAGLEPKTSLKIPTPMATPSVAMVFYEDKTRKGLLSLTQVGGEHTTEEQLKQMQAQMEAQMKANDQAQQVKINPESTKQHPVEIHGAAANFTISAGRDKSGREVRIAEGSFKGASGVALLYFLGASDAYSEETLEKMLDSMK